MRIKKVKVTSENRINIEYESGDANRDEFSLICKQAPMQSFYDSLDKLNIHVIEMCELPEDYLDRIIVRGVTFSYGGEKEVMGATIIARMRLNQSNVDLNLNTPYKASESYSESPADEAQMLSYECVTDLNFVIIEAMKYVNGERAQIGLFEGGVK